jgi:hypothetical protein
MFSFARAMGGRDIEEGAVGDFRGAAWGQGIAGSYVLEAKLQKARQRLGSATDGRSTARTVRHGHFLFVAWNVSDREWPRVIGFE